MPPSAPASLAYVAASDSSPASRAACLRRLEGGDVVGSSGDDDTEVLQRLRAPACFDQHLGEVAAQVEVAGIVVDGPLEGPDDGLRGHNRALYRCPPRATLGR